MQQEIKIYATRRSGGLQEFIDKGTYADRLHIFSEKHDHSWLVDLNGDAQTGVLRLDEEIVFQFIFNDNILQVKEVINGVSATAWQQVPVDILLCD